MPMEISRYQVSFLPCNRFKLIFIGLFLFLLPTVYSASWFGDIYPVSNATYDLGNNTYWWRNVTAVYLRGKLLCSDIYGGSDSDFCADATGASGGGGVNISSTTCSGTQKISAINNATGVVTCSADVDTVNTTSQMIGAINGSGVYNITSWFTYYVNNATERSLFTSTYNVTYHNYVVANISAKTDYMMNITERNLFLSDLTNTTSQVREAVNGSDLYYQIIVKDLLCTDCLTGTEITGLTVSDFTADLGLRWENLTDYPTACSAGNAITALSDSPTCSPFQTGTELFNTTSQVKSAMNDTGNEYYIFKSNETLYISCTGIYGGSDADFCSDAVGGGGSWINYWQVSGTWMFPNTTAGGQNSVNVTQLNTTTLCVGSDCHTNWFTYNATYDAKPSNTYNASYDAQLGHNTSAEVINTINISDAYYQIAVKDLTCTDCIGSTEISGLTQGDLSSTFLILGGNVTEISNSSLASTFLLGWSNITSRSLDINWGTSKLGWGNLTGYNLQSVWTGTLGGGNLTSGTVSSTQITDGTITASDLASTFTILLGNITNPADCTAGNYVYGKSGSTWQCRADQTGNTTQQIVNVFNTTGLQVNDDVKIYLGTDKDVYIIFNSSISAGQLG